MSLVRRVPVTEDRLRYIVANLRERDRAEIFALRWDDDEEKLVQDMTPLMGAMCCVWERDGEPVAVQGAIALWPGCWSVFAFGTEKWRSVVLDMTRHARRFIIPALQRVNFHRAECRALRTHTDSRKWITSLGAQEECILEGYGRKGEDFVSYVWRPEDVRWRRRRRG